MHTPEISAHRLKGAFVRVTVKVAREPVCRSNSRYIRRGALKPVKCPYFMGNKVVPRIFSSLIVTEVSFFYL